MGAFAIASDAQAMANTMVDFGRHVANGDTAFADLDAATLAAEMQTATGNYFMTMGILGTMMEVVDSQ